MKSLKTNLLWLLMGALAVSAGTGLFALMMPGSGMFLWVFFGSAMSLVAYTLGFMACARVGTDRSMRWLAIPAGALLIVGYAGVLTLIWSVWTPTYTGGIEDEIGKLTFAATILGVTLVGTGLMSMIKARLSALRTIRLTTIVLGSALGAMSVLLPWEVLNDYYSRDTTDRVFSGLLILTSVGVLATLVLRRVEITKLAEVAETGLPALIRIALTCPRCDLPQELPSGGSVCKGCGLAITIEVAEPVCSECGYSLAGLTGAECPECGVEIPADVLRLAGRTHKAE